MKTYIVLDESGAMHLKKERFFVIGGFITNDLHKVKSVHKKVERIVKLRKNIPIDSNIELKSSKINVNQQALFLNELAKIKEVIPISIVVDKENLNKLKATENLAYNFFVKTLLNYLFRSKISMLNTEDIELRVDNRNVSVKQLKDLETFLEWEFNIKDLNFSVKYLNSKYNREVQMADYVANLMWKKYNVSNEKLSKKTNIISHMHISKFPIKLFNKNPSLKEQKVLQ